MPNNIVDEGTPRYRDLDEEAKLQATEARAFANIVAPDQISSLSALAVQIVNSEHAMSNVGELIARAGACIRTWVLHRSDVATLATNGTLVANFSARENGGGSLFAADDKRTFGQIIADCERIGFDTELVRLMRAFNLHRTRAVHKFILGATDYEHLRVTCARYTALPARVGVFTRKTL